MSIIEKAAERLQKEKDPATGAQEQQTGELRRGDEASSLASADRSPSESNLGGEPAVQAREEPPPVSIQSLGLEGIISAEGDRSRTAEEFRMIKRPLLNSATMERQHADAHTNLIMISSSLQSEGKTFTSLNLAISMAMEMDRTVLLVDADVAKPGLSRLLGVSNRLGLIDRLLDDKANLADMLLHTDVPKLTLLPAGSRNLRSTELLGSNAMKALLNELAVRYADRIVVFDSPPLLETSEANVLSGQMGQVVLVVESGVTPQSMVKDALAKLDSIENVSLVLNKHMPSLLGAYGGGYGYGYSYGYGYGRYGEQ